jgi:hypothetical protein
MVRLLARSTGETSGKWYDLTSKPPTKERVPTGRDRSLERGYLQVTTYCIPVFYRHHIPFPSSKTHTQTHTHQWQHPLDPSFESSTQSRARLHPLARTSNAWPAHHLEPTARATTPRQHSHQSRPPPHSPRPLQSPPLQNPPPHHRRRPEKPQTSH